MQIRPERFHLLVRSIAASPITVAELAELAGVSRGTLAPGYAQKIKQSTMEAVAKAAAKLLHLEDQEGEEDERAAQLLAWLMGNRDASIERYLRELPSYKQCGICKGWFKNQKGVYDENVARCVRCDRDRSRLAAAAKSKRQGEIRADLRAQLPRIEQRDPELAAAVVAALDSPEAITLPKLAARLPGQVPARSLKERLRRAATAISLIRLLGGPSSADTFPRAADGGRRRGSGRRPVSLGSGPPPQGRPQPKRRKSNATAGAAGSYKGEEASA